MSDKGDHHSKALEAAQYRDHSDEDAPPSYWVPGSSLASGSNGAFKNYAVVVKPGSVDHSTGIVVANQNLHLNADPTPVYTFNVTMSPLNPLSHRTTVRRGHESGMVLGDFEMGIHVKPSSVMYNDVEKPLFDVLSYSIFSGNWTWCWTQNKDDALGWEWSFKKGHLICRRKQSKLVLARWFVRPSDLLRRGHTEPEPPLAELELEPEGYERIDEIVFVGLLMLRKVLTPTPESMHHSAQEWRHMFNHYHRS